MSEIAVWLRRVIEGDKAYAEADFEWELVKAKGGYNETITRAAAELAIVDLHAPRYGPGSFCAVDDDADPCDTIRALASGYRYRDGWKDEWAVHLR